MKRRQVASDGIARIALQLLARARSEFSLDIGPPVPVELIAEIVLGLRIERQAGHRHSGELDMDAHLVLVDSTENELRQRYTIAHEVGHLLLHVPDAAGPHRRGGTIGNWRRVREWEADSFAAHLLMPFPIFEKEAHALRDADKREDWAQKLAQRFAVSRQAAGYRLTELLERKSGIKTLKESEDGGRPMESSDLLREVGVDVTISSLANQGRAAIKQVLEGLRSPEEVKKLLDRGLRACDLLETYADAEEASKTSPQGIDLSQIKAYEAYEPLRVRGETFSDVKAAVQRARQTLNALLTNTRPTDTECKRTMEFFAKVAEPYQEAAVRALMQVKGGGEPIESDAL